MWKKTITRTAILLFWTTSMLGLARFVAFPALFTGTLQGYRGVLEETILMQEIWARILINGTPAGFSHTSMGVDEEGEAQNIEIYNRTQLSVTMLGNPLGLNVHTTLLLDPQYELRRFESAVSARGIAFRAIGEHTTGRNFTVTTYANDTSTKHQVEIPENVVLYSPLTSLALRHLRNGQELTLKTLDPLSMTPTRIQIRAIEKETIRINDTPHRATRLVSTYHGMTFRSWVDKNGLLLRQENPLGWVIERCSSEAALDAVSGDGPRPDLSTLAANPAFLQFLIGSSPNPLTPQAPKGESL